MPCPMGDKSLLPIGAGIYPAPECSFSEIGRDSNPDKLAESLLVTDTLSVTMKRHEQETN